MARWRRLGLAELISGNGVLIIKTGQEAFDQTTSATLPMRSRLSAPAAMRAHDNDITAGLLGGEAAY